MKIRTNIVAGAFAVVVCGGIAVASVASAAGGDVRTPNVPSKLSASIDSYDLQLLQSTQTSSDLPKEDIKFELHGNGGLRPETLRLVATTMSADTYVGLDNANYLCEVVVTRGDDWVAAGSCTTPDAFNARAALAVRATSASATESVAVVNDSARQEMHSTFKAMAARAAGSATSSNAVITTDLDADAATGRELPSGYFVPLVPAPTDD